LNDFDGIVTQCNNIERSNDEIKKILNQSKGDIERELSKIITSLKEDSSSPPEYLSSKNIAETEGAA
jgi:hypothetical protein